MTSFTREHIADARRKLKTCHLPGSLFGVPVIESPHMTKTVTFTRNLTWKERLWAWPWRPWVREVAEQVQVPSDEIFAINCDGVMMDVDPPNLFPGTKFPTRITGRVSFVMHPGTAALLCKGLEVDDGD